MTRPYSRYVNTRTGRSDSPDHWEHGDYPDYDADHGDPYGDRYEDAYGDAEFDDYDDYDDYDYDDAPIDRRWVWVAGVAGAVLLVAVVCTVVILGGSDSGSVSATVSPPSTSAAPSATTAAPPAATTSPAPPPTALAPETITTVTPTATATAPPVPPPTQAAPPPATQAPVPSPRTITYRVTGNRQLIDLVTVIYTDHRGALQTDLNIALPWAKTVVLDPGVELSSVTATSVAGQLNCSITDAAGVTIAEQSNNTMIANCTK